MPYAGAREGQVVWERRVEIVAENVFVAFAYGEGGDVAGGAEEDKVCKDVADFLVCVVVLWVLRQDCLLERGQAGEGCFEECEGVCLADLEKSAFVCVGADYEGDLRPGSRGDLGGDVGG